LKLILVFHQISAMWTTTADDNSKYIILTSLDSKSLNQWYIRKGMKITHTHVV